MEGTVLAWWIIAIPMKEVEAKMKANVFSVNAMNKSLE